MVNPRWMRSWLSPGSLVLLGLVSVMAASHPAPDTLPAVFKRAPRAAAAGKAGAQRLAQAPLHFELNQGQTDRSTKFLARGPGYQLHLRGNDAVITLRKRPARASSAARSAGRGSFRRSEPAGDAVLRMKLLGAKPVARVEGRERLAGSVNYFIGADPARWRTQVPLYAKVHHQQVYPGIDLVYYGNDGRLEYDFIVAPRADPQQIRLGFEGAEQVKLAENGALVLRAGDAEVRWQQPVVYQQIGKERRPVEGRYRLAGNEVRFALGEHDPAEPLIIDPVLVYSTYLGGSRDESGEAVAVDGAGNSYVTGNTNSLDFPVTPNAYQVEVADNLYAFVTKLSPTGALLYSTYLGGGTSRTLGFGIAVDTSGNAYVTGLTGPGFPTYHGFQDTFTPSPGKPDAFLAKLGPAGDSLLYSTYLGGGLSELGRAVAVDEAGGAFVAGMTDSSDFPVKAALQSAFGGPGTSDQGDAFVARFDTTQVGADSLVFATYLGGADADHATGIALGSQGDPYVVGQTFSNDFPTHAALQPVLGGLSDAFVARLKADGSGLYYSTYLGGSSYDNPYLAGAVAVDAFGSAYVAGATFSGNFPTTPGALQTTHPDGDHIGYVTKFLPDGSGLDYSTLLGGTHSFFGNSLDEITGIAVDATGSAFVVGWTRSDIGFPLLDAVQPTLGGLFSDGDGFATRLNPTGSAVRFSSYLGGSAALELGLGVALDAAGNASMVGYTLSTDFPTANAIQPARQGLTDAFVARIALSPRDQIEVLIARLQVLVAIGSLQAGTANGLTAMLTAADRSLAKGNENAAGHQLAAFNQQAVAAMGSGHLSPSQGEPLVGAVTDLIRQLGG